MPPGGGANMSDGTKRLVIATIVTVGFVHLILMAVFKYQIELGLTIINTMGITAEPTYGTWIEKAKVLCSTAALILIYTHIASVSPYKGVPGRAISAILALVFIGVTIAMISKTTVTLGEKVFEYLRFFILPMAVSLPVLIAIGGVSIHPSNGTNMGITDPLEKGS